VRTEIACSMVVEDADPCVQTWIYALVNFSLTVEIVVVETVVVVVVVVVLIVEILITSS
jgi:hypothetical protein